MISNTIAPTYISDKLSGIFSRMSISRLSSMASGVSSSLSLARKYLMISDLLGPIDILIISPGKLFSISARIWDLPDIRVPGDFSQGFVFSEPRILIRCTATHSSRASMHMNVRCEVIACSIFTISGGRDALPSIAFFYS